MYNALTGGLHQQEGHMRGTNEALIIIDVQKDFCPGGALAVNDGDAVVPVINRIAPQFHLVVATQDWHPQGHASFASSHKGRAPFDSITLDGIEQTLWPDHCVVGTPGAQFHHDLELSRINLILRKGSNKNIDSYSAFLENDRATVTGLRGYLRDHGIDSVTIAGLATDYCVYFSATDARDLGFRTRVMLDACRGIDTPPGSLDKTLKTMKGRGIELITSGDILNG